MLTEQTVFQMNLTTVKAVNLAVKAGVKKVKATFAQALVRKGKPKKGRDNGITNQTNQNSHKPGKDTTVLLQDKKQLQDKTDNSRVVVSNACWVWGTLRSCTTSTIKNAIST